MRTKGRDLRAERAFLKRVRAWMETKNISQAELARRTGASPATVSEWFVDGVLPMGHFMLKLPSALGVSAHWLLTGNGSPTGKVDSLDDETFRLALEELGGVKDYVAAAARRIHFKLQGNGSGKTARSERRRGIDRRTELVGAKPHQRTDRRGHK